MLDPTDSFFVEAAREMLERSHYVIPCFNYADWPDKPAFAFWLIVLCYKIFGICEFAARLPSALSGIILALATFTVTRHLLDMKVAWFAFLLLLTSPLYLIVGHVALTDEPLALCIGLANLSLACLIFKNDIRWFIPSYFALAVAVLCKGPIALVLFWGSLLTYACLTTHSPQAAYKLLKQARLIQGFLILGLVCLPYYAWAHITTHGAFTQEFFFHQNLGRFEGTVNHQEPWWWYFPVSMAGYFPWSILFLLALPWLVRLIRHRYNRNSENKRQSFLVYCLSWVFFTLILFTVIPTKLPTYIVSISPALAIIGAAYLKVLVRKNSFASPLFIVGIVFMGGVIGAIGLYKMHLFPNVFLYQMTSILGFLMLMVGVILALILLVKPRRDITMGDITGKNTGGNIRQSKSHALMIFATTLYCSTTLLVPTMFYQYYLYHQSGLTKLIELAKNKQANLCVLFSVIPSAVFIYGKRIETIKSLPELKGFCRQGRSPHYLLATGNCLAIPQLEANRHLIATDGKWYLLTIEDFGEHQ